MPTDPDVSRRAWLWPLIIAATIFLASSRSQVAGPPIEGSDKVEHFFIYGLLGTLLVRLGPTWKNALVFIVLVSAYGVSDEWHQSFTPGRSVEVADWMADTLGGALAITLYTGWGWYRRWLERPIFGTQRRIENEVAAMSASVR